MNRSNPKQQMFQIALVVVAFVIGWFSHRLLQPFFSQTTIASPGEVLDDQVVVFKAPDTEQHGQQPIRIDTVRVLQQSPDALLLELDYHYSSPIPAHEVKIYVGMFSSYLYLGEAVVQQGASTARMRLSIIDSKMQEDGINNFRTETMQISFQHYAPDGYKGVLTGTDIAFTKEWALPR